MTKRIPVTFTNRDGLQLFGVLHRPESEKEKDTAIILLSPGVKMRVGPHRLYNKMTKQILEMGYPVFRFDFYGLGDSEGELHEDLLADVYNHIELGRYVNDTVDSMDWMEKEQGISQFILSGLCGGAITGLLAGGGDDRVTGLLSLGMTAVLASSAADPAQYMTKGQLNQMREGYLKKLWKPKSWYRLLTFQSDYKIVWRSVIKPLFIKLKLIKPKAIVSDIDNDKQINEADNSNPLFAPAFFNMVDRKRPMLYIFSGADRLYWEFEEKFVTPRKEQLSKCESMYEVHTIENANHVFSFEDWQKEMINHSRVWLNRHFK